MQAAFPLTLCTLIVEAAHLGHLSRPLSSELGEWPAHTSRQDLSQDPWCDSATRGEGGQVICKLKAKQQAILFCA